VILAEAELNLSKDKPFIAIAGLARCGTSLTMQMLQAAGIPCIGDWPAFEVDEVNHRPINPTWLARFPGHAFKWLDPHLSPMPETVPRIIIWLDRDPVQQAKSQAKFTTELAGFVPPNRAHMRRWAASLRTDRTEVLRGLAGYLKLIVRFEDLIDHPERVARSYAMFLRSWWPDLDHRAMAAVVRRRSSDCAPGLELEFELVDQTERGAT
jgi:hypothetical protein